MNIELYKSDFLNFVELNFTGGNDEYRRCDPESRYLDTTVFSIFLPCFEHASELFDYFAGTKYNSRKIIVLRNELKKNLEEFENISSQKNFISLIEDRFMGKEFLNELAKQNSNWQNAWNDYRDKLIALNKEMITFTEKCADEERILWVVGY